MALNRTTVLRTHFFLGLRARPAAGFVRRERGTVRQVGRGEMRELVAAGAFEQTVAPGGLYMKQKIFGVDLREGPLDAIERRFLRREDAAGATW